MYQEEKRYNSRISLCSGGLVVLWESISVSEEWYKK
jgi:hypothetical protein